MGTNQKKRRRFWTQACILVLILVAIVLGAYRFGTSTLQGEAAKVVFELPDGKLSPTFELEIASTNAERTKGLMYRKPGALGEKQGMLFIFPEARPLTFWMKNTYIALDIIFLDADLKVMKIFPDVPVLTDSPRNSGRDAMYVVELLAGSAKRHGITEGSRLRSKSPLPAGV